MFTRTRPLVLCALAGALLTLAPSPSRADTASDIKALKIAVASLQSTVASQQTQINTLKGLTSSFSKQTDSTRTDGKKGTELYITGMNLHIVNGLNATNGEPGAPNDFNHPVVNGLGNVIIGYNEGRGPDDNGNPQDVRTGSHNLVLGQRNNYSSIGGIVVGAFNTISGPYANVTGGNANTASGFFASISGGASNTATGTNSSVEGGENNTASGGDSSVSGGSGNLASSTWSSVSGGLQNTASNTYSTVSGGYQNLASGTWSSVSGGYQNAATNSKCSVSGGYANTASGDVSSVSGGQLNKATGQRSSVSGGYQNNSAGLVSSVSGGANRTAPDTFDWVAGGLFQDN